MENHSEERPYSHMWTKEEMRLLIKLWDEEDSSTQSIAEKIGVTSQQVSYMAAILRRKGFNLPLKRKNGVYQNLIDELKAEMGVE